jgi:hypothetical protein
MMVDDWRGLSAGIDAGLAGDKDETMRAVDLDHLAVSRRLCHPGRIGMPHVRPCLRLCRTRRGSDTGGSSRRHSSNNVTA